MKAVWYERTGPAPEVLAHGEMPTPVAGPGEVRVRLEASGVNPADVGRRGGSYRSMEYPRVIPNSDGAGIIDQVGDGVTRFKAGHAGLDGARCSGSYIASGAAPGVRVAQPRPRHGERSRYDMEAKRICYLVGVSFVRCGGPYREHYDERRCHLQAMHPAWAPKRIHMAAMRATVKRFLVHLWTAWNELATAWPAAEQTDEPPSARQAVLT